MCAAISQRAAPPGRVPLSPNVRTGTSPAPLYCAKLSATAQFALITMKAMVPRLIAVACLASTAFAAQNPPKILPYDFSQQDLPNGLRLIVVPTSFPNIVATYIVVQSGSRNEVEPGHTGFAHLFEHLMFRGTERFPAVKYNETLRRIGAASNAFTTDDFTCYYTVFSKEDLPTVLDMEADRFQHLKYPEPAFKTESLAILGEYNKNSSSPFSKLDEVLSDTAFDKSTYKHTTMGFLKDIQDMPNQYEYSLKFFDRYYRPEYTTILVVGDVQPKAVRALVDKFWGEWKRGSYKPEIPKEPPQEAPRTAKVDWPTPTLPIVAVAFKAPAYDDESIETAALDALAALAFSPSSDLYRKLVIDEQKVESLSGSAARSVDPTLFFVTARVKDAKDVDYVRDQILATVKAFQEKPVDPARLDTVRRRLRYSAALSMQSSDAIAGTLARFVALRRTPETMNKLYAQYARVTPEDVQKAAAKYLTENNRTIVTLAGPAARGGSQ
jgi:zinc protease